MPLTIRDFILENPSATDAEILALLPKVTPNPTPREAFVDLLLNDEIINKLRTAVANAGLSANLRKIAQQIIDIYEVGPAFIPTNDRIKGPVYFTRLNTLRQGGVITLAEMTSILLLGGGLVFNDTTIQDVAAARALLTQQQQQLEQQQAAAAALQQRQTALAPLWDRVQSDHLSFVNNVLNPALSNPALPLPTLADWQAFTNR